ncbi:hypothetical protein GCM10010170_079220 [Dactylosporangium salmoneum]|uniref:Uncharacterized protein n=1 Tax=Dactylosporangium salmoneum TaxID=53361 RepID=A0ABN3HBZ0_9ACTN
MLPVIEAHRCVTMATRDPDFGAARPTRRDQPGRTERTADAFRVRHGAAWSPTGFDRGRRVSEGPPDRESRECDRCGGRGRLFPHDLGPPGWVIPADICPECEGSGSGEDAGVACLILVMLAAGVVACLCYWGGTLLSR